MRFLGHLFSFLTVLLLLGVAAAIGLFWWYGRDLPDYQQLANYQPAELSKVYAADGAPIAEFARERRIFAPIAEVPDLVKQAFISAEDKNFYNHPGVDVVGLGKAFVGWASGGAGRGASTITQQVVKNMLIGSERKLERKVKEAILAIKLERAVSKDRILELYLNQIYLGARANGVAAAAQTYFGKTLAELGPEEAAYLAALPKAPSKLHPVRNHDAALGRRNYVLKEMFENGALSEAQYQEARAKPLATRLEDAAAQSSPDAYDWSMAYAIEEIRSEMIERVGEEGAYGGGYAVRSSIDPKLQGFAAKALREGLSEYDRREGWRGPVARMDNVSMMTDEIRSARLAEIKTARDLGDWRLGVVLETGPKAARLALETLPASKAAPGAEEAAAAPPAAADLTLQSVAWARKRAKPEGPLGPAPKKVSDVLSVGDVVYVAPVDPKAREGMTWELRQIPLVNGAAIAMDPHTGRILALQGGFSAQASVFNRATQAKRQPGSSFKPIVYAAALDHGYTPATIVLDAPITVDQGPGQPLWRPENYSRRFNGPTPVRVGLERSYNAITVRIAQDVGMDIVGDYAKRFGVYDSVPDQLSYALGAGETTLLKLATAYSMIANGGERVYASLIDRIQDRSGVTVARADERACADCAVENPASGSLPQPEAAERVLDPVTAYQMTSMMEGVIQRGTATRLKRLGFPIAGKTGTSNDAKDAWFIGFTPDLVFGCFMGFDEPKELGKEASGGGLCGPVFEVFMGEAMKGQPVKEFQPPQGVHFVKIDRRTGQQVAENVAGEDIIMEAFRDGTGPNEEDVYAPAADIYSAPVGEAGYSDWGGAWAQPPAPQPQPLPAPGIVYDINGQPVGAAPLPPQPGFVSAPPPQPQIQIQPQPQAQPAQQRVQIPLHDAQGRIVGYQDVIVHAAPVATFQPQPQIQYAPAPAPQGDLMIDPATGRLVPISPQPILIAPPPASAADFNARVGVY